MQHRRFARNLAKLLTAVSKDKKKVSRLHEGKSAFQTIAIEIYKKTKTKLTINKST